MLEARTADWKARLKAWWEGYYLPNASGGARRGSRRSGGDGPDPLWSASRFEVLETVWGDGFTTPGGTEHVAALIKPLGLNEKSSVVELGAGLGGGARFVAQSTGAWVTGLEADRRTQEAGQQRSSRAGFEKRAPVFLFDAERPEFDKHYDAILAREALYAVANKDHVFEASADAMKPGGHLAFTDYLLQHSAQTGEAIAAWKELEPVRPFLWTANQTAEKLESLGFDVRIVKDVTDAYVQYVLTAWDGLTTALSGRKAENATAELLLEEGELWMRRVAALSCGDLRIYRFHAIAKY